MYIALNVAHITHPHNAHTQTHTHTQVLDMFSDLTSSSVYLLVVEGKGGLLSLVPVTPNNAQLS